MISWLRRYCLSRILYCAATRANYILRVVHPSLSATCAKHHDASLRRALAHLLSVLPSHIYWDVGRLPFAHGGVGLRSAEVSHPGGRIACQ